MQDVFVIIRVLQVFQKYLNNYEPIKGIKINGSLDQLLPNKIVLTPNAIVAMIVAKGQVAIKVEGL